MSFEKYLWALIIGIPGSLFFSYLIYGTFAYSFYITLTDENIIGKNSFKIKVSEIRFKDIIEIFGKGKSFNIKIRDTHGKSMIMNTVIDNIEELLNTIISKAINCKRIDLRYIHNIRYSGITVYERGLQKKMGV